ncbi:transketolase family protein [Shewanella sp.]|uniref:transketolase family protein n=1 Tax=Shewanella sp. TaxID=50422 RepID=UPI003A982791
MSNNPSLVGQQGNSLREAFGIALTDLANTDDKILVMDADVAGGTGTHHFRSTHPERFIQCGIAEQNMISAAAGLATTGFKPFVTTFATFMLRGIEQIRLSVAYSKKNVKFVASHPGLDVGPDGASAQCIEDMACMRAIPSMVVLSPADAFEITAATKVLANYHGPAYMRSGRSPCPNIFTEEPNFEIGKGYVLHEGGDITIISCGVMTHRALSAAKALEGKVSVRVLHMPSIKPIDREKIIDACQQTNAIVTCEDHSIIGGLGSAVAEVIAESTTATPLHRMGLQDVIGRSGEPDELAAFYGLDTQSLIHKIIAIHKETDHG